MGYDTAVANETCGVIVVKLHVVSDSITLPATSITSLEIIAVYALAYIKGVEGLNVAVRVMPVYVTAALTETPSLSFSEKVAALILAIFIGSLNRALMDSTVLTFAAPLAGMVETTAGGMVSGVAPVVKFHE
jgi:hypothetical protein